MKGTARSRKAVLAALFVSLSTAAGCSFISAPRVKVEEQETLSMPAERTQEISVHTHNGHVTISGAGESQEIVAHVHKRARARTLERARECMAAIELTHEESGTTRVLGWKWNTTQAPDWNAVVTFDIEVPRRLTATVTTHNGHVNVTGIEGDCNLETHNGRIQVESSSHRVDAESYNGAIRIASAPEEIRAATHNGAIAAEFNGTGNVVGAITTYNGSVALTMNDATSANFHCSTHNGGISSKINLTDLSRSRRALNGRKGDASGELRVQTHNGSITLKEND